MPASYFAIGVNGQLWTGATWGKHWQTTDMDGKVSPKYQRNDSGRRFYVECRWIFLQDIPSCFRFVQPLLLDGIVLVKCISSLRGVVFSLPKYSFFSSSNQSLISFNIKYIISLKAILFNIWWFWCGLKFKTRGLGGYICSSVLGVCYPAYELEQDLRGYYLLKII